MIEWHHGQARCEDAALADLAARFGTPTYVYSAQVLRAGYRRIAEACAPLHAGIRYSVKANANGAILRLLREWGAGFDVVAGGELYRSLRAGADPGSIVFAGVGKTDAELRYAVASRVGWINVECREELEALDPIAAGLGERPRVALRLNPAIQADTHPHIATGGARSKFGIDLEAAERLLAEAGRFPHLRLDGIHIHIGSQLASPDGTVAAAEKALALIDRHRLRGLNLGGGFPVDYGDRTRPVPGPAAFVQPLASLLKARDVEVLIEPGRSIVAEAGLLLTRVLSVKWRADRQIVIVDAGMTDLIRPALYDASHPVVPLVAREGEPLLSDVAGPVCEAADTLARDRPLLPLQRGDLLAVTQAGAYGMAMASNYNSRPRAAEILVRGDAVELVRRRETYEDLVSAES